MFTFIFWSGMFRQWKGMFANFLNCEPSSPIPLQLRMEYSVKWMPIWTHNVSHSVVTGALCSVFESYANVILFRPIMVCFLSCLRHKTWQHVWTSDIQTGKCVKLFFYNWSQGKGLISDIKASRSTPGQCLIREPERNWTLRKYDESWLSTEKGGGSSIIILTLNCKRP